MGDFKNCFKGTIVFLVVTSAVFIALRFTAGEMNAGSAGFRISLPFLAAQAAVNLICYIAWYRKVNARAADMMRIGDMRKTARRLVLPYAGVSFLISSLIAAAAAVSMLLGILFVGIPELYCLSSVIVMALAGNFTLLFLMLFLALPDRVTGYY